jgi:outer membrane lipoprotein-sorting protein
VSGLSLAIRQRLHLGGMRGNPFVVSGLTALLGDTAVRVGACLPLTENQSVEDREVMTMSSLRFAALTMLCLGAAAVSAGQAGPEFSADMVQRGPDGKGSSGMMFVGDGKVRIEMTAQGQNIVRINDESRRVEWVLFPDQKHYLERKAGPDQGEASVSKSIAENPCAGAQGLSCRKVGDEDVSGRPTAKWEITGEQNGKPVTSTQWIDVERGIPLRQQFPDGGTMVLSLQGKEVLEGRPVEKWEVLVEAPGRQATRTYQWYDPELKLAVRQEFPGGGVSELKNIRVGKQPDDLFVVPAGYSMVPQPQGKTGSK